MGFPLPNGSQHFTRHAFDGTLGCQEWIGAPFSGVQAIVGQAVVLAVPNLIDRVKELIPVESGLAKLFDDLFQSPVLQLEPER